MAALTGQKPKDTYKDLLQVSNSNDGIDSTLRLVSDGGGTDSVLKLSTTAVTVAADITVTGTVLVTGDTAAGDDAAIGYTSAEGIIITGQGSTSDVTIKNDADAAVLTIATGTTNVDIVGDVTASTVNADGDTAASDNAAMGYTSAEGLILTGQGSTNDITVKNDADADVLVVATGTTNVDIVGDATAATFKPDGDTAASDTAAIGYTSAEGIIVTGQGSTNDVTIKNDADADVLVIPTGTTNVTIAGDLTISGDDLTMGTNTSGAALIADGTNFNPVVISGDGTIATNGALTIANNAVSLAKMAGLARGKIIYGDSSGDPAALTVGSSGEVLKSDGTDIAWAADSAGAVTSYTNSTDNRVITSVDSATINGEANLTFDGSVLAVTGNVTTTGTVEPAGDTAASDNAAIGYTSAEGIIITGQGSTNDVTIKNDADADVITIPTGTTGVTIAGDLTISGDDLIMGTNTSGAALIADGTNFNPVVISGDAAIATNGALTITDNAVSLAKMAGLARGKIIYGDSSGDPAALAVGSASNVLQTDGTDVSWSTVATAGVADNAITLAKMAGLARGKIIYGDSSGDPAALTVGSANYFLKSDGTDIAWAAATSAAISSYTNSGDNRVITSVDSSTVNGEANLSFDGSVLAVTGNVTATGTVEPAGDTASSDNAAIGYTSAEGLILTGQGSTNDVTLKNDADGEVFGVPTGTTGVTFKGVIRTDDATDSTSGTSGSIQTDGGIGAVKEIVTDATFQPLGDTAASDKAAIGYTSAEGIIITGQGSTNDVTIKNDADADVITIATGTTNVDVVGDFTAGTLNADGDTAASDNAAIGYTSAEGLILTGQGSTNDVTIKNDADADVITIPTGATGVVLAGALTLGGAVAGADNQVGRVNLIDYGEVTNAIGGTGGGTQDIDLTLGNNVVATVDTNTNTFTFSNPTASDDLCGFTLFLTNGGSQTVNWPSSVDWAGGTAPTLTTSGIDILVFITTDGGTIWHGMVSSADSKSP
jgi:hypothetical protein